MKDKSAEEVLEALTTTRVDMLDEEATRLFEVIMKVIDERDELNNRIGKAIDTLYCWGEVLDADFQNKMLNILKGNDEDYVRADVYEETLNKIEKR